MSSYVYYNPEGYNPSTGIYASSQIFTDDWENELAALNILPFKYNLAEVALTIAPKVDPKNLVLAVELIVKEPVPGVSLIVPPANSLFWHLPVWPV